MVTVSASGRKTKRSCLQGNPFKGHCKPRFAVSLLAWILCSVLVFSGAGAWCPVYAVDWTEGNVDLGIGLLGLPPLRDLHVQGFPLEVSRMDATIRERLWQLPVYAKPGKTQPVSGNMVPIGNRTWGIQFQGESFPIQQAGLPMGDERYGIVVKTVRGRWAELVLQSHPQVTAWVELKPGDPTHFTLWYRYFEDLIALQTPVMFVTPVSDDVLYQGDPRALSQLKHLFQMDASLLYPEAMDGAYMKVRTGQDLDCSPVNAMLQEKATEVRGWIRWLTNTGRPRVMRAPRPDCSAEVSDPKRP